MKILQIALPGIGPDQFASDQSDNTQQDPKLVKELLISSYDKNISTRLKTELCNLDVTNYSFNRETSKSKHPDYSLDWELLSTLVSQSRLQRPFYLSNYPRFFK